MSEWQPIEIALRIPGKEILGIRLAHRNTKWTCVKEPFVSFWSPTLDKFFCDPTHFIIMPDFPEIADLEKLAAADLTRPNDRDLMKMTNAEFQEEVDDCYGPKKP